MSPCASAKLWSELSLPIACSTTSSSTSGSVSARIVTAAGRAVTPGSTVTPPATGW
jgi:hypothetical protein